MESVADGDENGKVKAWPLIFTKETTPTQFLAENNQDGFTENDSENALDDNEFTKEEIKQFFDKHKKDILKEALEKDTTNLLHLVCAYLPDNENFTRKLVKLFDKENLLQNPDEEGMEPLHVAAKSANLTALKCLMEKIKPEKRDRSWKGRTVYTLLMCNKEYVTNFPHDLQRVIEEGKSLKYIPEHKNRMECLKFLLESELDINKPDYDGVPPVYWVTEYRFKHFIKIILDNDRNQRVDLDSIRRNGKTARELILELQLYPRDKIPTEFHRYEMTLIDQLFQYVRLKEYDIFAETLKSRTNELNSIINDDNGSHTLLQYACENDAKEIVKTLLENGANPNKIILQNRLQPLHIALERSGERGGKDNKDKSEIVDLLLKHGASLSCKNRNKVKAINYLKVKTLKEHLNGCIKEMDEDEHVEFNFKSLLPPQPDEFYKVEEKTKKKHKDQETLYDMKEELQTKFKREMDVVLHISKTSNQQELLLHPVISAFLYVKWHMMRWFFYGNVASFLGFSIAMFFYIFYNVSDVAHVWKYILLGFVALQTAKELLEMFILGTKYFFVPNVSGKITIFDIDFQNVFDLGLLLLVYFVVFIEEVGTFVTIDVESKKIIFITVVLLTASELLISLEQMPHVNYKIAMMKKVAVNIFKTFLLFATVYIPFALCFTIMYNRNAVIGESLKVQRNVTDDSDNGDFYFFDNILLSIFKTVVMMSGEYDMKESLDFERYPFVSSILFFIFVFVVVLVCFNLLIGIAVSDIQTITKEAELLSLIARTQHICYIESLLKEVDIRKNFFVCEVYKSRITVDLNDSAKIVPEYGKRSGDDSKKGAMFMFLEFFGLHFLSSFKLGPEIAKEVSKIIGEHRRKEKRKKSKGQKLEDKEHKFCHWMKDLYKINKQEISISEMKLGLRSAKFPKPKENFLRRWFRINPKDSYNKMDSTKDKELSTV